MLKIVPAIFLGCVVAILTIIGVEIALSYAYTLPENFAERTDSQYYGILLGYALGSCAGGAVATRMNPENGKSNALVVALILLIVGVMNMINVPYPTWFWGASCSIYVVFALLGSLIYSTIKKA
jgi:predicted MFS family arabinose efflux permease